MDWELFKNEPSEKMIKLVFLKYIIQDQIIGKMVQIKSSYAKPAQRCEF